MRGGAGPWRKGAWLGVPGPLLDSGLGPCTLPTPGRQANWPGCGAVAAVDGEARAVGVARGRGPAGGGAAGAASVKARAAAAGASGRCVRACWGAGSAAAAAQSAAAAAARLERPRRGSQLQRGRRSRDYALSGAGGHREQVIPAGTRSPTESWRGGSPHSPPTHPIPSAAAAAPAAAGRERHYAPDPAQASLRSREPPQAPASPGSEVPDHHHPQLPGARPAAEQSCGRVPIAKAPSAVATRPLQRSLGAPLTARPRRPPAPGSRPLRETASEAQTLGRGGWGLLRAAQLGDEACGRPSSWTSLGASDGM